MKIFSNTFMSTLRAVNETKKGKTKNSSTHMKYFTLIWPLKNLCITKIDASLFYFWNDIISLNQLFQSLRTAFATKDEKEIWFKISMWEDLFDGCD